MTSPTNNPSELIDTTYIKPALMKNHQPNYKVVKSINNILGMSPEEYKDELLKRINHFIDDLNEDFENGDYTSNYTGYIKLIEDYILQLDRLTKISPTSDIGNLKKQLNQIKENQISAKEKQSKKVIELSKNRKLKEKQKLEEKDKKQLFSEKLTLSLL